MSTPDFFLTSTDDFVFARVRKCYVIRPVLIDHGTRNALLVRIDPPVTPGDYSSVKSMEIDKEIHHVVLTEKWERTNIYPKVSKWPLFVYVLQPLCDIEDIGKELEQKDYLLISWSEIYKTEEEALEISEQFLRGWK